MKTRKTKQQKQIEARVDRMFSMLAGGVQIPIMSLNDIFDAGVRVASQGGDDLAVGVAIQNAIDKVRLSK